LHSTIGQKFNNSITPKPKITCALAMHIADVSRRANKPRNIAHPQGSSDHRWKLYSFLTITGSLRCGEPERTGMARRTQGDERGANLRRKGSKGDTEGWTPIKRTKGHVSFVRESCYRAWERSSVLLDSERDSKPSGLLELDRCRHLNRLIGDPLL